MVAGATVVVLFGAELTRVWRLGSLARTRSGESDEGGGPVRASIRTVREGYRYSAARENAIFHMVFAFVVTFGIARTITYGIRTRGRLGPIRDLQTRRWHIHHFIPGALIAFAAGGWSIASPNQANSRRLALPYGVGLALVIDEVALLLELEDVYWSDEGVLSVQVAFGAMSLFAAIAYALQVRARTKNLNSVEQDWELAASAWDDLGLLRHR